jgi:hypothetical protein
MIHRRFQSFQKRLHLGQGTNRANPDPSRIQGISQWNADEQSSRISSAARDNAEPSGFFPPAA